MINGRIKTKRVVILGSTGSIGVNTLDIIRRFPGKFKVVGLTAYHNLRLLEQQIKEFSPTHVAVSFNRVGRLRVDLQKTKIKVWSVESDLSQIVSLPEVDTIVIGMSGSAAIDPFLSAVRCGKTVAPANKEALVVAGDIIMKEAKKNKAVIVPVDSEQSAIFQCLDGHNRKELKRVYLTASGGAAYHIPQSKFDKLTVRQILTHPRWRMGKKITVDSATLMNKGFEIIEAKRLFDLRLEQIKVVIHPEAIIHSMVSFKDGSIMAQMGVTDMRLPIQFALTYPERWETGLKEMDFFQLKKLTFLKPDEKKFPSLTLAFYTAKRGGTLPSVLNAADEEAVNSFLKGDILFSQIYKIVEKIVLKHKPIKDPSLKDIFSADRWARRMAQEIIYKRFNFNKRPKVF